MAKKTTVKLTDFEYGTPRTVLATVPIYTKCRGLLKGFAMSQDDANSTDIESELYSSPWDQILQGKPIVFKFELVNFDLPDLVSLFGGTYTPGVDGTSPATYDAPDDAYTTDYEWKISFQKGFDSLVMFCGMTIGTIKKDQDGALSYSVTVTSKPLLIDEKAYIYRINDKLVPLGT